MNLELVLSVSKRLKELSTDTTALTAIHPRTGENKSNLAKDPGAKPMRVVVDLFQTKTEAKAEVAKPVEAEQVAKAAVSTGATSVFIANRAAEIMLAGIKNKNGNCAYKELLGIIKKGA
jgi:hypothetical protein